MSTMTIASSQLPSIRRPRFRRANPPPLRVTTDDLAILRHVGEHRFLRSTHLIDLLGRSPDKLLRRLGVLFHNGYLDRPRTQLDYFARSGSAPLIYALGNKGADLYTKIANADPTHSDWTDKNRDAKKPYLEHALLIADVMIALERAARLHPTISLIAAHELTTTLHSPKSWTLTAKLPGLQTQIAVTPDKVFALHNNVTGRRNYFLLEADRSTMPIERASLAQSSFKKKLLAYHYAHAAKRHVASWGIPGFRVLTVTKSHERIGSMLTALNDITNAKGSNVFLFAEAGAISKCLDLFALELTTGKNKTTTLIK